MTGDVDIWRLAAGLGLFLYGMYQLERALQRLAGRPFKQFLRQQTANPIRGVLTGAAATAALQSSSVVGLIVLAFVGAGILTLASAIGIVFGSNLGTTATGWLVATIGFKLDIEAIAMPVVALGALGVVWSRRGSRRYRFSQLGVGFGLLLIGLDFMKSGTAELTQLFSPEALSAYPSIVFLLAGFLLTAVIQSSSATITITLSALNAGVIPLHHAAAVAIGADLGTTITIMLGAMAGSADKKRVAAALILFNVVADVIAFILLVPLLGFINNVLDIRDPLYSLVAFHSLFNLIGVGIFLPLTGSLSRRLEGWFTQTDDTGPRYLPSSDAKVPEAAIDNLRLETRRLVDQVTGLNQLYFGLKPDRSFYDSAADREGMPLFAAGASPEAGYLAVKRLEGEITQFGLDLERQPLDEDESAQLRQIFSAVRDAVHSAKCVRDTQHDLEAFGDSVNDTYHGYLQRFRDAASSFFHRLEQLRGIEQTELLLEKLSRARQINDRMHKEMHASIYERVVADELGSTEISTVLNANRELYNANQNLLFAIADLMLDLEHAEEFRAIPYRP